jgi:hypothetical protein
MSTSEKVTLELLLLNGSNYTSWSTRVLDVFRDIGSQFEWIIDLSMSPPVVSIFFPANPVPQGPCDHLEARRARVSLPAASAFCPHGLGLPRRGPHLYLNKFCQTSLPALSSSGQDWLFGWWRICGNFYRGRLFIALNDISVLSIGIKAEVLTSGLTALRKDVDK